jgi:hypothetical protein
MRRALPLLLLVVFLAGCGSGAVRAGWRSRCVVLKAVPPTTGHITAKEMARARYLISERLDEPWNDSKANVTRVGADEIVVDARGADATGAALRATVLRRGQLEIFDLEAALAPPSIKHGTPAPFTSLYRLLSTARPTSGEPSAYYLFKPEKTAAGTVWTTKRGPTPTRSELLAPFRGTPPAGWAVRSVPAGLEVVRCARACPGTGWSRWIPRSRSARFRPYWYLFQLPAAVPPRWREGFSITTNGGRIVGVVLGLSQKGSRAFKQITRAEYDRGREIAGRHRHPGQLNLDLAQHFAIVFDGRLMATPWIDYTDTRLARGTRTPDPFTPKRSSYRTPDELSQVANAGPLPYAFRTVPAPSCPQAAA